MCHRLFLLASLRNLSSIFRFRVVLRAFSKGSISAACPCMGSRGYTAAPAAIDEPSRSIASPAVAVASAAGRGPCVVRFAASAAPRDYPKKKLPRCKNGSTRRSGDPRGAWRYIIFSGASRCLNCQLGTAHGRRYQILDVKREDVKGAPPPAPALRVAVATRGTIFASPSHHPRSSSNLSELLSLTPSSRRPSSYLHARLRHPSCPRLLSHLDLHSRRLRPTPVLTLPPSSPSTMLSESYRSFSATSTPAPLLRRVPPTPVENMGVA